MFHTNELGKAELFYVSSWFCLFSGSTEPIHEQVRVRRDDLLSVEPFCFTPARDLSHTYLKQCQYTDSKLCLWKLIKQ